MQHGQRIDVLPRRLLTQAGFKVREIPEGHLCCGSAGAYNILEPEIALRLRGRKIAKIVQTSPDSRRYRKHRLHRSDRERHIDPGAPYDRTPRLRPWRANCRMASRALRAERHFRKILRHRRSAPITIIEFSYASKTLLEDSETFQAPSRGRSAFSSDVDISSR